MSRAIKQWDEERRVLVRVENICAGENFGGNPNTFFFQKLAKELPKKKCVKSK